MENKKNLFLIRYLTLQLVIVNGGGIEIEILIDTLCINFTLYNIRLQLTASAIDEQIYSDAHVPIYTNLKLISLGYFILNSNAHINGNQGVSIAG